MVRFTHWLLNWPKPAKPAMHLYHLWCNDYKLLRLTNWLTDWLQQYTTVYLVYSIKRRKRQIIIFTSLLFVSQLTSSELTLKHSHIKSTNLLFLEAVLLTVEDESDVTAVFKPFCFLGPNSTKLNCTVDIVASSGCCWIKVTARNASALHRTWQGIYMEN